MPAKQLPFDVKTIQHVLKTYPTPFYIYDERGIRKRARELFAAFSWCQGFKEFFAVKATPNPYIVDLLHEEGCGADCSSLPELVLCERIGVRGEEIMFTSNNTPAGEYQKARQLGAIINLDDISHIDFLLEHLAELPELISFRYNPGPYWGVSIRDLRFLLEGRSPTSCGDKLPDESALRRRPVGNTIIGRPEEAKYGLTLKQLFDAYGRVKKLGVKRFGLHTMVASNELNPDFFIETARMLFELAVELAERLDVRLEFVNLGGGIGIPYRPEDKPVDLAYVGEGIRQVYDEVVRPAGLHPLRVFMENGRVMTGPFGFLVTKVLHRKDTYKHYVGVDACMANLMRPGMYGAYHHITVLGKEDAPAEETVDVVGSLCENNDKFAINRKLPKVERGDVLVIHDAGAHGHAMGFQYNGKLRCAELLLREDGSVQLIRRAETVDDYFATLDFSPFEARRGS